MLFIRYLLRLWYGVIGYFPSINAPQTRGVVVTVLGVIINHTLTGIWRLQEMFTPNGQREFLSLANRFIGAAEKARRCAILLTARDYELLAQRLWHIVHLSVAGLAVEGCRRDIWQAQQTRTLAELVPATLRAMGFGFYHSQQEQLTAAIECLLQGVNSETPAAELIRVQREIAQLTATYFRHL